MIIGPVEARWIGGKILCGKKPYRLPLPDKFGNNKLFSHASMVNGGMVCGKKFDGGALRCRQRAAGVAEATCGFRRSGAWPCRRSGHPPKGLGNRRFSD